MNNFGSVHLFAGIGGAALGFRRAGFEQVALCEIDPWRQKVLRRHWPRAQIFDDVCSMQASQIGQKYKVLTGGFPCQDISYAKRNAVGLEGSRSRLWYEQLRIIDEGRPDWVVAENSVALRSRGLDAVLRSLDEIRYDAEWHCIKACHLGGWHKRDRVWILAYPRETVGRKGLAEKPLLGQSDLSRALEGGSAKWPGRSNLPSPRLCRGDDGVPERAQRIMGLGDSVYTPIPEMIARAIQDREVLSHDPR